MNELIITGCGRGGTTAIAGVIRHLGLSFPNANEYNEEPTLIRAVRNNNWYEFEIILSQIRENYTSWGVKHPWYSRDASKLLQAMKRLKNPGLVHIWRDPYSIADHRFKLTLKAAENVPDIILPTFEKTMTHLITKELPSRIHSVNIVSKEFPVFQLSYEKLIQNPEEQVESIRSWLNFSDKGVAAAIDYIKPGSYHPWEENL